MKALLAGFALFSLAACAPLAPPAKPGSVDHVVLVWLKRPGNAADRQALRRAADEFRTIPGLRALDSGTPLASERPAVDDSFDVGFVMRFDSPSALRAYESHPLHQRQVREVLKPLAHKVVVYDMTH